MDSLTVLREGIHWGHGLIEQVMVVTTEQAHTPLAGSAHSIAAIYAHGILAEDGIFNGMLRGGVPTFAAKWSEACGIPAPTMVLSQEWSRGLRVDLEALRLYSHVVSESTQEYLVGLAPTALDEIKDLSGVGLDERTVGWMLNVFVVGHLNNMAGELSCRKGLQGLKGYPF